MRPVTPFMAIRTVLRVTAGSFRWCAFVCAYASGAAYARRKGERHSKRFLFDKKLASEQRSIQDREGVELFEGANNGVVAP